MIIPLDSLNDTLIHSIVTEFVSREGTDYGIEQYSQAEKIEQVKQQLQQGTAIIVYSQLHETVNIIASDQYQQD